MISCLPSLGLAASAFFQAFVGGFSAVALMEARDKAAGAALSSHFILVSKHVCPQHVLLVGREINGNPCQERGRPPGCLCMALVPSGEQIP